MAQKANLTPVDKYESDRREAQRLDLEKHARLEAGLIDPVSAIRPAPTAEHQHREVDASGTMRGEGRRTYRKRCLILSMPLFLPYRRRRPARACEILAALG
jgi:hypothetical protein